MKLDAKVIIVATLLLILALVSFFYWTTIALYILKILESKFLTFLIWVGLIITLIIHYNKNYDDDKNLISDKEGLEKPIDYVLFIMTYGAIGTSIQVLSKITFININFQSLSRCPDFTGFDNFSFIVVIIVLVFYSYIKIKPIIRETYINKEKIRKE